jgi:hypothetical protein
MEKFRLSEWWDAQLVLLFKIMSRNGLKLVFERMQGNTRDSYYYWKEVGERFSDILLINC